MTESLDTDSILVQGTGEAASIVEGINFSRVLNDVQHELAKEMGAAFANQSTPDGDAWAPLAKTTQSRKGLSPILVRTGALRASLIDVGGAQNVDEITSHELVYGTGIDYATFHETGTKFVPARPVIGINTATLDQLATRVADATAAATASTIADAIGDAVVEKNVSSSRTLWDRIKQISHGNLFG